MPRSRAELERIRAANRARIGLGAAFPDLSGALSGVVRQATVRTAFPSASVTYEPGAASPQTAEGSAIGAWLVDHVVRPEVEVMTPVGVVSFPVYQDKADYSPIARAAGAALTVAGVFTFGWLVARAFS